MNRKKKEVFRRIMAVKLVLTVLASIAANGYGSMNFVIPSTDIPRAGEIVVGFGKGINLFEAEFGMLDVGAIGISMYGGVFKIRLAEENEKLWWSPGLVMVYSSMKGIEINSPTGSKLGIENLSTFNLCASRTCKDSIISVGVLAGSCDFTTSKEEGSKGGIAIDPYASLVIPAPNGMGKMFMEVIGCVSGFEKSQFSTSWYEPIDRYNGLVLFPPFMSGVATGMVGLSQELNLSEIFKLELGGGVAFDIPDILSQNTLVLSGKLKFKIQ